MRRSLMEDYKISPKLVVACEDDIKAFCENGIERGGHTIHCLMEHAHPAKGMHRGARVGGNTISKPCFAEVSWNL